jgi:hypothetical protein
MTILRRLVLAECDRRPRVLPPIVILHSPDDYIGFAVFIAITRVTINHSIARLCRRGISPRDAPEPPARLCNAPSRTCTEGILNLHAITASA